MATFAWMDSFNPPVRRSRGQQISRRGKTLPPARRVRLSWFPSHRRRFSGHRLSYRKSILTSSFRLLAMAGPLTIATPTASAVEPAGEIQTVQLRGDSSGKRFDGISVVNGGGATSVLLEDVPEPQRSQILDLVYKPMFGAPVSALLVEIPGDDNSTKARCPATCTPATSSTTPRLHLVDSEWAQKAQSRPQPRRRPMKRARPARPRSAGASSDRTLTVTPASGRRTPPTTT